MLPNMKYEFPIVPAGSGPLWLLGFLAVLMVGLVALFSYLAWSSRHVRFEVTSNGLTIRGDLYGRTIPAASLKTAEARAVDLTRDTSLRPKWRTNGAGLPGYGAGWFRLNNGEKALLFVTDRSRVAYVPTRDGYSLLVSVPEPGEFIRALQESAGGG